MTRKRLIVAASLLVVFGVSASVLASTTIQQTLRRPNSLDSGLLAHYTFDGPVTDIASPGGEGWVQVTGSADFAQRTRTQGFFSYDDKLWLIGGWDNQAEQYTGDIWSSEDGADWDLVTSSPAFGPKATHETLVYDGRMWVIGGGDLSVWYSYDGANWTQATSNAGWGGSTRNQHAVVEFDGRMWMMGGTNGSSNMSDVWYSYDGANWTRATSSAGWSPRQNHRVAVYDDRIWLTGGGSGGGEVWYSYDGANWTQATSDAGWGSLSKYSHGFLVYDDKMWVIAGRHGAGFTSGVWWSEDGVVWTQATANPGFSARGEMGATVHNGRMWILGGLSAGNIMPRDVWATDSPSTNQVSDLSGNGNHGSFLGGQWKVAPGKVGQALSFDGVSDYVSVGDTSGSARSISFWVKPESDGPLIRLNGSSSINISGEFSGDIRFVGSSTGTTSATLPAHQAGDLILAFAYRDGNNSPPSIPNGWTNISNSGGSSNASRLAYRIATGSGTSSGTWSSATSVIFQVYRGAHPITPIGTNSDTGASSSIVTYPELLLQNTDGSSWVAGFAGHRNTNTSLELPPRGMVMRANVQDSTDEASGHDTGGGVSSWPALSVSVGGTSSGWRARTVEILPAPNPVSAVTVSTSGITSPTIYVNGELGSQLTRDSWNHVTITSSSPISVSDLEIGRDGDNYFRGAIDDVRLYTHSLSANEADRVFHVGATTKISSTPVLPDLDAGLTLHFTFDGDTVSDGVVTDVSGSGNHGTYGTTQVAAGKIGQGMLFDGTAGVNMVVVPDDDSIDIGTGSFTYGAWIKSHSFTGDYDMPIYKGGASAGDAGWGMELGRDGWGAGLSNGSSSPPPLFFNDNQWSPPFLSTNQWYHLMVVLDRDNDRVTTYRNGEIVDDMAASSLTGNINSSHNLTLGGRNHSGGFPEPFHGVIDDLRVYKRALTTDEVRRLYRLGGSTTVGLNVSDGNSSSPLQDGLVAQYSFDGPTVSGSTVSDIAGSNNGTIYGGVSPNIGMFGQGMSFPGSGRIQVPYHSSLNPTSAVTYTAWIKWGGNNGQTYSLQNIITNGGWNRSFRITESTHWNYGRRLLLNIRVGSTDYEVFTPEILIDGQWHHVAATYDGSRAVIYLDGYEMASQSIPGSLVSATGPTIIGAENSTESFYLGAMDDVRIYNRALSSEEIQMLVRASGRFVDPPLIPPSVDSGSITTPWTGCYPITLIVVNGTVVSAGSSEIEEVGFVLSTSSRSHPGSTAPQFSGYEQFVTHDGAAGLGAFAVEGRGNPSDPLYVDLDEGITYYVRPYAKNSTRYAYGGEVSFVTPPRPPICS